MKKRTISARTFLTLALTCFLTGTSLHNYVQAAAGDLDPTFGSGGRVISDFGGNEDVSAVLVQQNGKIVAVGSTISGENFTLARYNSGGTLDSTFGAAGKVTTDFFGGTTVANSAVLQPDGKVIVGGTAFNTDHYVFALARYNTDGSLDQSFGTGGKIATELFGEEQAIDIALQPDGKVIAIGAGFSNGTPGVILARYSVDGNPDPTFGFEGKVFISFFEFGIRPLAVALQPDNKIVIAGWDIPDGTTTADFALVRFNNDGSVDTTFGTNGVTLTDFADSNDIAFDVAVQIDGKIVAVGRTDKTDPFYAHSALARYNSDGSLDPTFGMGGKITSSFHSTFDEVKAVLIQKDGKIVIGGQTVARMLVARYNSSGSLDLTFGSSGRVDIPLGDLAPIVKTLAIQGDEKIVAAGLTFNHSTGQDFAIVRLESTVFDTCLQDESNGNLLQIDTTTGNYQFTNCNGLSISGTGLVTTRGSTTTLQHSADDRRVTAKIDSAINKATASIQVFSQGTTQTITDRNTTNNSCFCK